LTPRTPITGSNWAAMDCQVRTTASTTALASGVPPARWVSAPWTDPLKVEWACTAVAAVG
jgi:hypothetical protein